MINSCISEPPQPMRTGKVMVSRPRPRDPRPRDLLPPPPPRPLPRVLAGSSDRRRPVLHPDVFPARFGPCLGPVPDVKSACFERVSSAVSVYFESRPGLFAGCVRFISAALTADAGSGVCRRVGRTGRHHLFCRRHQSRLVPAASGADGDRRRRR